MLRGIEIILSMKFGEEGGRLLDELRAIDDNGLLGRILERIPKAKSVAELRRIT